MAAPLRRLSLTHQKSSTLERLRSWRIRPTKTSSRSGCLGRQGIASIRGVVDQGNARGYGPERASLLDCDRPLGLHQDRFAVTEWHGHAHACRGDVDGRIAHDLAGLVDHLQLFLGVPAGNEIIDLRNAVADDLMSELRWGRNRLAS